VREINILLLNASKPSVGSGSDSFDGSSTTTGLSGQKMLDFLVNPLAYFA
jgi:hypothetical protein